MKASWLVLPRKSGTPSLRQATRVSSANAFRCCYESGNIVGAHYFKYQDDAADSVRLDSKGGANKGLFNAQYVPYDPLVQRAQAVNLQAYSLIDFFDKRK